MVENSKSVVNRKEIKQRVFADQISRKMLKIKYFGHAMRTHQSLEKYIMFEFIAGARKKKKETPYAVDG